MYIYIYIYILKYIYIYSQSSTCFHLCNLFCQLKMLVTDNQQIQ